MGSDVDEAWARRDADEFEHNALMRGRASALCRAADIIRRAAPQGGRVLDVGCGVGLLGEKLGDLDVVGVDFSDPLLRRAKSRLGAVRGVCSRFRWPITL